MDATRWHPITGAMLPGDSPSPEPGWLASLMAANCDLQVLLIDGRRRVIDGSPAVLRRLDGLGAPATGRDLLGLVHPDDRDRARRALARVVRDGAAGEELRLISAGGESAWFEVSGHLLDSGGTIRIGLVCRDVSERVARRTALEESEQRYRAVVEGMEEGVMVLDRRGRVLQCNRRAEEILGLDGPEGFGTAREHRPWDTIRPDGTRIDPEELPSAVVAQTGRPSPPMVMGVRRPDGTTVWVRSSGQPLGDAEDGDVREIVCTFADLTGERQADERINQLASHDALTGLPNNLRFRWRLAQVATASIRHGRAAAVAWVDATNLAAINDSLGHAAGDAALCEFAERLQRAAAGCDLVAHHVGDEFLVLIGDAGDTPGPSPYDSVDDVAQIAQAVADRIQRAMQQPFQIGAAEVFLGAWIGIAVLPRHATAAADLLRQADLAMYRSKAAARSGDTGRRNALDPLAELSLSSRLHHALEAAGLELHYQPIVTLQSRRMVGVEALLRWHDQELGSVSPADFIPVAERAGLIEPISEWVLERACDQAVSWHRRGLDLRVAVNIPPALRRRSFVRRAVQIIDRAGIDPARLVIEITEGSALDDLAGDDSALNELRALGVTFAIDDFGTGYSSLARLTRIDVSTLKIDRSFIHGLPTDPTSVALSRAVIQLAGALGRKTLAEGIETERQRAFLLREGCLLGQGHLFGAAMPAADIPAAAERLCGLPEAA